MSRFAPLLLALTLAACGPVVPEDDATEYQPVALSSEAVGVQPFTGIVLWSDNGKAAGYGIQLEFSYMLYNDVCKSKDGYDWTVVDKLLDKIASRGHQAVLRFRYTYPGYSCAVPDYIKALPDYEATNGRSEGRKTEFPDWRCSELQRFHKEFHRRFAERYDKDPRLAYLQTGFGLWAEYHIYDGPFVAGKTFPSKAFQKEFFEGMEKWFVQTPWMISIDAADDHYGPFSDYPALLDGRFGNFDDSFMCEDHDGYNRESWSFFGTQRYKRAPFGGEFSYYTDYDQKHCLDPAGIHGRRFEDEVARFHMSFIIGNDQPGYQKRERVLEASRSMGYHFRINAFGVCEGVGSRVEIENTGVAPIYHDAFVCVDGKRGDYNLRALMPGEKAVVKIADRDVSGSPVLSIACDRLVEGQSIGFDANLRP